MVRGMHGSAIATGHEGAEPRGWTATQRDDFDRAFRIAKRHSRAVRFLRIAVPVGVVAAIAAVWVATWLNPVRLLARLPAGTKLAISGRMEVPQINGFTNDKRPYEFTARTAAQDLTRLDRVELTEIRAKMEAADKSLIEMSAVNGVYATKVEQLLLREEIVL